MRAVALVVLVAACETASPPSPIPPIPPSPPVIGHDAAVKPCTIELATSGRLAIDGAPLPDLGLATLRAALGEPDRIERTKRDERYEEWGAEPGDPKTSSLIETTHHHYVYDRRGIVFVRRGGKPMDPRTDADHMFVFVGPPRTFTNRERPEFVPAARAACLAINGIVVDPAVDQRPAGVTYRTEQFPLYGTQFGPTSIAMVIDGLYAIGGDRAVTIHLDGPATGRASYVEIR